MYPKFLLTVPKEPQGLKEVNIKVTLMMSGLRKSEMKLRMRMMVLRLMIYNLKAINTQIEITMHFQLISNK